MLRGKETHYWGCQGRTGQDHREGQRPGSWGAWAGERVFREMSQWAGHVALTPLLCGWSGAGGGHVLFGPGGLGAGAECGHGLPLP